MNITLLDGLPKAQPMVNNLAEYRSTKFLRLKIFTNSGF